LRQLSVVALLQTIRGAKYTVHCDVLADVAAPDGAEGSPSTD
jgi:hypothetical protein